MSLTLIEARARAEQLSDVSYAVELDLTDPASGTFGCRTTVRFRSTGPGDVPRAHRRARPAGERRRAAGGGGVRRAADRPHRADRRQRGGGRGAAALRDRRRRHAHVHRPGRRRDLRVGVRRHGHRPAGLRLLRPERSQGARRAHGDCRPGLDGAGQRPGAEREDGRWRFATTPPIPTAMFVVCAGPWHSRTWEHAGIPFGWHARRSLRPSSTATSTASRPRPSPASTTTPISSPSRTRSTPTTRRSCRARTGGRWRRPGCVTYRDEYLPRGRLTDVQRTRRTSTIAHEMAHMWFGDLVTMTWWEDTWLQESFADYMGYRVAGDAAGEPGALVDAEIGRKPTAFDADQRRSTHPVAPAAEDVPDVDAAANNFDMISYAKGNATLRQLATWLGDETFLAGLNAYLTRHRLRQRHAGRLRRRPSTRCPSATCGPGPTRGCSPPASTRSGSAATVTCRCCSRDGSRPHRIRVTAYDDALAEHRRAASSTWATSRSGWTTGRAGRRTQQSWRDLRPAGARRAVVGRRAGRAVADRRRARARGALDRGVRAGAKSRAVARRLPAAGRAPPA